MNCNCKDNCGQPCCKDKKLDLKFTTYSGPVLTPLNISPEMSGEEIIIEINEYLKNILIDLNIPTTSIISVGNGVEVYKGLSDEFSHEFKSLEQTEGIKISNLENTIRFQVDEIWLASKVAQYTVPPTPVTTIVDFRWSNEVSPGTPILNPGNWHTDYIDNDGWMAMQEIINGIVNPWKIIRVKGKDGIDGIDGNDGNGIAGQSSFTSIVFKRSAVKPTLPSGGTYTSPIPTGWSDGIPPESNGDPVWMSTRTFSTDGLYPQQLEWSEAEKVADTADIDFEFSSFIGSNPGTPTTPLNGATWHDGGADTDVWMAVRKKSNGTFGAWSIVKVKGENSTSFTSIIFKRSALKPALPIGGSFNSPVPSGWSDGIPPESNGDPVWMSIRVFSSDGQPPQQSTWSDPQKTVDTSEINFEFSNYTGSNPGTPTTPLNGATWHDGGQSDDVWMAIQKKVNGSLQPWTVVKIRGENVKSFTSIIFKRATNQPATPTTGSFAVPVPITWSDGVPVDAEGSPVWMSIRLFTEDGSYPQAAVWTVPQKISDTSDIDFEFSDYSGAEPGTPSVPLNSATWHNEGQPDDVWMAVKKISNGVSGPWSVVKIRGEDGVDGQSGGGGTFQGILTSFVFTRNELTPTQPTGGSYSSPKPSQTQWTDGVPTGTGKVWMSTRIFSTDGLSPQQTSWGIPVVAIDNSVMDYAYSSDTTKPIPPSNAATPTQADASWHEAPTENDIWQAMRTIVNGIYGTWTINRIKGEKGTNGTDGVGIQGTTGAVPRLLEWVVGNTYVNNDEYKDFIYFRTTDSNSSKRGWYIVTKPTPVGVSGVANAGNPDVGVFTQVVFQDFMSFGTVIAEQANIAGFIFRNQVLTSQAESYQTCTTENDRGPFPNLTIDGLQGIIKFLERMVLNKDGITLIDDCGRNRMAIKNFLGVPSIKFYNEDGTVSWEAGKDGYKVVYIPTRPEAWIPFKAFYQVEEPTGDLMSSQLRAVIRSNSCQDGSDYYYGSNEYFAGLAASGYMYDKGVKPTHTTEEDESDQLYFTAQSYSGSKITDGYYMTNFYFTRLTNSSEWIVRTDWSNIVSGKIISTLQVDYPTDTLALTMCTTTQKEQWEQGY